jgi:sensor histidine kinase YesM
MTTPVPLRRTVARWAGLTALCGLVVGALYTVISAGDDELSLARFAISAAISTMYSALIGLPAMLALRVLKPRFAHRSRLAQWAVALVVVLVASAIGALIAGLVQVAVGLQSMSVLWFGYERGLEISLAIAVPIALGAGTYATLRARLATTEASLQTKELDHQRALALAAEARLASLESRVRPHFLFNALNSAIALIPEDPRRAEQLLVRLAGLLRSSLDASSATVTVADELRVVSDYLEIERVRFGDRLRYELDVADDVLGERIPAFAIQTVVENSVKYAVSARKAGATIAVAARRAHGELRLAIRDDGPGFAGAIWQPGHGLDALRARLDALYGGAARLEIDAGGAPGARVTIALPEVAA